MQGREAHAVNVDGLDEATRELVELSIVIATAREPELHGGMRRAAAAKLNPVWVE
jgi:alkylhydroperoxidase/carboxymuconolactone decarboxylase family protein YurZ